MTLSRYLTYQRDSKIFGLSLSFSAATFVIYSLYFDILAPFIPGGSVRQNSGPFFEIPVLVLLGAQTLFITYLVHIQIKILDQSKRDLTKAYLASSATIFLFSIFYALFPYYGPYAYVVYFMPGNTFPSYAIPVLVIWTLAIIFVSAFAVRRLFHLDGSKEIGPKRTLLMAATILAVIIAMAS